MVRILLPLLFFFLPYKYLAVYNNNSSSSNNNNKRGTTNDEEQSAVKRRRLEATLSFRINLPFCSGAEQMSAKVCLSRLKKRRKIIGTIIPIVFCAGCMVGLHAWQYKSYGNNILERVGDYGLPRYIMSIVMVFGSMIAGATSEGGASVAFPVMTLALNIDPVTARDFSLMIQTVEQTAAAITILSINVLLERNTIMWVSIGGAFGIIVGLECIAPMLPPAFAKMYFVVIWAAFALSLYFLNTKSPSPCI